MLGIGRRAGRHADGKCDQREARERGQPPARGGVARQA
jgi:hypothetical protein